ncbi:MAG: hypothetical protein IJ905_09080 [Fibrobacter sp.]|nr:hypothetical protein [Fibrobacter sp.]
MIKLFKNFSATCTAAFVAFCVFACSSDNLAGTAEEPNQFAHNDSSSSSELNGLDESSSSQDSTGLTPFTPHKNASSSSQDTEPSPHNNPVSSSSQILAPSEPKSSSTGNYIYYSNDSGYSPMPTSSSNRVAGASSSSFRGGNGGGGHFNSDTTSTLDDYLENNLPSPTTAIGGAARKYTFDSNVLAYNLIYESCDLTKDTCSKPNEVPVYQTVGLHKIDAKDLADVSTIFPITAKRLGGTLKSSEGCSLYMLNLNETTPAVHVITQITKDSILLTNIFDNCDYERMPFDRYVGFLFEFCEELSESTKIVTTDIRDSTMKCGGAPYKEYVRK